MEATIYEASNKNKLNMPSDSRSFFVNQRLCRIYWCLATMNTVIKLIGRWLWGTCLLTIPLSLTEHPSKLEPDPNSQRNPTITVA